MIYGPHDSLLGRKSMGKKLGPEFTVRTENSVNKRDIMISYYTKVWLAELFIAQLQTFPYDKASKMFFICLGSSTSTDTGCEKLDWS